MISNKRWGKIADYVLFAISSMLAISAMADNAEIMYLFFLLAAVAAIAPLDGKLESRRKMICVMLIVMALPMEFVFQVILA